MAKTSSSETIPEGSQGSTVSHQGRGKPRKALTNVETGYELVELGLLDEPVNAIRATMDEPQLLELCQSIAAVGLLQPLVVERNGARYRVVAGHRRLVACQAIRLQLVPCLVREHGSIDPAAVTIAENYYREAVNPAEEAAFLEGLLTSKCNGDTDLLAALIHHKREYVEDRILLLRGDPAVLAAIKDHKITLAVARELQKVRDADQRTVFLDAACRGGATSSIVRNWRQQAEAVNDAAGNEPPPAALDAGQSVASSAPVLCCFFCGDSENVHMMQNLWVHSYCRKVVDRAIAAGVAPKDGDNE